MDTDETMDTVWAGHCRNPLALDPSWTVLHKTQVRKGKVVAEYTGNLQLKLEHSEESRRK